MKKAIVYFVFALVVFCFSSCEKEPDNNLPVISSITASVEDAFLGEIVKLSSTVTDIDDDIITYIWIIEGADIEGTEFNPFVNIIPTSLEVKVTLQVTDGTDDVEMNYIYNTKECKFYDTFENASKPWSKSGIDYSFLDGKLSLSVEDTDEDQFATLAYSLTSDESFIFSGFKTSLASNTNLIYDDYFNLGVSFQRVSLTEGEQISRITIMSHPGSIYNVTSNWTLRITIYNLATNKMRYVSSELVEQQGVNSFITNLDGEQQTYMMELSEDGSISVSIDGHQTLQSEELKYLIIDDNLIFNRDYYKFYFGIHNDCELTVEDVYIW